MWTDTPVGSAIQCMLNFSMFLVFQMMSEHQDAFQAGSPYPDAFYGPTCYQGTFNLLHEISSQWSGSRPMVQHYFHGITISIHPKPV